jgi:hypothetical protein
MTELNEMKPIFRIDAPSDDDLAAFHRDGYVVFPGVFSDEGLQGLTDEIMSREQVVEFFEKNKSELVDIHLRSCPWNNKGPWGHQLFDAPFVTALLRAIIGKPYHFCHSTLHVKMRGCEGVGPHRDHLHWFNDNPINLANRDKWYVQMLYYVNGFEKGDAGLSVVPGSHLCIPKERMADEEELLKGVYDEEAGRELKLKDLELPPGSMVCLSGRTIHAAAPKPVDSPQEYRLNVHYLFKEAGAPHKLTQPIPEDWLPHASPECKKLFQREPYTEGCWLS